ncbi:ribosomal-protein-serine acetyltransferase [Kribbella voronezhensis]|uniref:Ribosomal-protein-serine acetyltransferase n=1 Tax=Kribbella voronezhensis TaxID=2512212 RepID=A0A4R7TA02_9ACTN|nr:GNAT family protein [Kribbella voronezhensis]TDU88804.1 ribosomal-protein-serine acetyltransferase [Kribbella voronezhensis]
MSTVTAALFTWPLGDDAALVLRTAELADAHFALVQANYRELGRWFPDAFQEPPVLEVTRAGLAEGAKGWVDGELLPLSIAVKADDGWQLVGWAQLIINQAKRSGEVGYWLDAGFVGRGLVTRAVSAILDHAFGPLGLERIGLTATADNVRSRAVAERLGFTLEGVLREAAAFPTGRRDVALYGLLSREWRQ